MALLPSCLHLLSRRRIEWSRWNRSFCWIAKCNLPFSFVPMVFHSASSLREIQKGFHCLVTAMFISPVLWL